MAIVKTNFYGSSFENQREDIQNWLVNNASDLFTTIEWDSNSGFLKCDKKTEFANMGTLSLAFVTTIGYLGLLFYPNPLYSSGYSSVPLSSFLSSNKPKFTYAIKTNCGIYLNWVFANDSNRLPNGLFLSRSNSGGIFAAFIFNNGGSTSFVGCVDLTLGERTNATFNIFAGGQISQVYGSTSASPISKPANYTVLTPMVSQQVDSYCPYLYQIHFNQFAGTASSTREGKLTLNKQDYFTNGYIALADY